ncbi:hypothetical protein EYF80_026270 [Liparis tanakae]|uniref:Uncharacterized protein n=1 Tax=Liparis tanakae TaxID=230148 RepID=A0A4Z2HCD8_9TELE|nr:hypothetical protein EYF80_026270 [Liparis tanakae]
MQRPLQLFERAADLRHRLVLPLVQLAGDLGHQLHGGRQLRKPAGGHHDGVQLCLQSGLVLLHDVPQRDGHVVPSGFAAAAALTDSRTLQASGGEHEGSR